jgi:hypothetical protein
MSQSCNALGVQTPLGHVYVSACVGGERLHAAEGKEVRVKPDALILRWETSTFEAEFIRVRLAVPAILEGRIDDSWAGIWRVRARGAVSACTFSCRWEEGFAWTAGGADSGEGLDAQTFTDGRTQVTIGTEDREEVAKRARNKEWMPPRLEPQDPDPFAEYLADGFQIAIPNLLRGERCQVQFLVAWSPDDGDVGLWLAVDRTYQEILSDIETNR